MERFLLHTTGLLFVLYRAFRILYVLEKEKKKTSPPKECVLKEMPILCLDLSFLLLKPSFPSLNNGAHISPRPSSITSISHYYSVKSSQRMTAEPRAREQVPLHLRSQISHVEMTYSEG